jgi:hypothetical protein
MRASLLALLLLAGGCATPSHGSRVLVTRAADWNDVARPQPRPAPPVEDRFAHENNFRRESRR